jgi:hypothetical protein
VLWAECLIHPSQRLRVRHSWHPHFSPNNFRQ